jgi:hypothetical protein
MNGRKVSAVGPAGSFTPAYRLTRENAASEFRPVDAAGKEFGISVAVSSRSMMDHKTDVEIYGAALPG